MGFQVIDTAKFSLWQDSTKDYIESWGQMSNVPEAEEQVSVFTYFERQRK